MGWEFRVFFPASLGFSLSSVSGFSADSRVTTRTDLYWSYDVTAGLKQRHEEQAVEVKVSSLQ